MIGFYKYYSKSLKSFNQSLQKQSIFVNFPWVVVNAQDGFQKLIFKNDGELIMSKNGNVKTGKWEYLLESKSLILDRGEDKILLQEAFVNSRVMVLRKDGTDNLFLMANEQTLPSLNIKEYLINYRRKNLDLRTFKLENGKTIEVERVKDSYELKINGDVTINGDIAITGCYQPIDNTLEFRVMDGSLKKILHLFSYETKSGKKILIKQKHKSGYYEGDEVYVNNSKISDGNYNIKGLFNENMKVENGIITSLSYFSLK